MLCAVHLMVQHLCQSNSHPCCTASPGDKCQTWSCPRPLCESPTPAQDPPSSEVFRVQWSNPGRPTFQHLARHRSYSGTLSLCASCWPAIFSPECLNVPAQLWTDWSCRWRATLASLLWQTYNKRGWQTLPDALPTPALQKQKMTKNSEALPWNLWRQSLPLRRHIGLKLLCQMCHKVRCFLMFDLWALATLQGMTAGTKN